MFEFTLIEFDIFENGFATIAIDKGAVVKFFGVEGAA